MSTCPYCKYENEDSEVFCSNCGRPLRSIERIKKNENIKSLIKAKTFKSKLQIPEYNDLEGVVVLPKTQLFNGVEYELIFEDTYSIPLEEYYLSNVISYEEIVNIERQILKIIGVINRKDFQLFFIVKSV